MATQDELAVRKFDQGVARIAAAAPSLADYQRRAPAYPSAQSVATPSTTAATSSSAGTIAGRAARGLANQAIANTELGANVAAMPARQLGGFARDAYYGFTGSANPDQGRPVGSNFDFGRIGTSAATPASTPASAAPQAQVQLLENGAALPARALRPATVNLLQGGEQLPNGALRASAPPAGGNATTGATAPQPGSDGIYRGRDANGNSVYSNTAAGLAEGTSLSNAGFGTGGPRRLPTAALTASPAPTGGAAVLPAVTPMASPSINDRLPSSVPQVPVDDLPAQVAVRGRQGAVIENPANTTVDRLKLALSNVSLKGSPSSRAAIAQAILGEANNAQAERMQTLRAQDTADASAMQSNAAATDAAATRRLRAQEINANLADRAAGRQQENSALRTTMVGADGNTYGLNNAGQIRQLVGADGQSFKAAPDRSLQLAPKDELTFINNRLKAIGEVVGPGGQMTDEQRQEADALRARADQLFGGGQANRAPYSEGQRLSGPDGKTYVVRNGQPVPEKA